MKKFIKLTVLLVVALLLSSCSIETDTLEDAKVYTTTYPINYLTKVLYKDHSEIASIYPNDADYNTYNLTKKQIKEYSKADLFIYNGLTNEKDIAKKFINKNSELLIIDVSNGLTLSNDMTELWLSPNNYLMLAKNIKKYLQEYVNSKAINDDIERNYLEFEEKISVMDASLHLLGRNAKNKNKNIIVASNDTFKYLNNYGFEVISLEDEANLKDNKLNTIKSNFNSGKYKYILTLDTDISNPVVNELKDNNKAEIITVDSLTLSLTDDYFDIMNSYIQNIKTITD